MMGSENRLYGLTRPFINGLDKLGTLNLLKRIRRLAQAASRIACVLGVTGALLLSSASYATAPVMMQPTIQMTAKMYAKANLPLDQYKCINKLYYYESRWNHKAKNGSHYGIPQGRSEWLRTATPIQQVKWGIKYNRARYSDQCKALDHFKKNNWH